MYIVTYQYSYIMLRKYSTPKSWVTIVEERSSPAWRAGDCGRPDQAPAAGSDWPSTPEENQGKTMGKPWENCGNQGKTMGNLEKPGEKPWESHGKTVEIKGKQWEIWKNYGKTVEIKGNKTSTVGGSRWFFWSGTFGGKDLGTLNIGGKVGFF